MIELISYLKFILLWINKCCCFASSGRFPRAVVELPHSQSSLRGLTWTRFSRRSRHLPLHKYHKEEVRLTILYNENSTTYISNF